MRKEKIWRTLARRVLAGQAGRKDVNRLKAEFCSVKKIGGCEMVSAGWRRGVICWRPEVCVCRTDIGSKCAGQAFKVVPRLRSAG